MKSNTSLLTFLGIGLLIFCLSCKKLDTSQESNEILTNSYLEKFFNSHRTSDSKENTIVNYVKRINEKENFVNNAVKQIGFPRWDKITSNASKYNNNSFVQNSDSSYTYFIPFVKDSQNFVNATLIIVANPSDTTFKFNYDWQYKQMQNSPNSVQDSAENFATFFMTLNKAVFGHKKFNILDSNLFRKNNKNAIWVELQDSTIVQNNLFELPYCIVNTITWDNCDHSGDPWFSRGGSNISRIPCFISLTFVNCTGGSGGGSGSGPSGGMPTGGGPTGNGGGCGNCGGGGQPGTGGSGWSPATNDDPPALTPCEIAQYKARQMDTAYAQSNVDSILATIPNLATETNEKGFPIFKRYTVNPQNVTDTIMGRYFAGAIRTGTTTNISYTFSIPNYTHHAIALHTHPPIDYSAHSARDVYDLIGDQLQSNHFEGSFAAAADGSRYALNVTDFATAASFYSTAAQFLDIATSKWNVNSNIGIAYEEAYQYYLKIYTGNPNKANLAYEMAMSAVLNQFNAGVTLSKKDITGKFKPIVVKTTRDPSNRKKKIYTQECL